jgi:hypothetical protein
MGLLHDLLKALRSVFTCKNEVTHGLYQSTIQRILGSYSAPDRSTQQYVDSFVNSKRKNNQTMGRQKNGGERGIRTLGAVISDTHDFQSCSFSQLGHLSAF